jgi:hypothetical protein
MFFVPSAIWRHMQARSRSREQQNDTLLINIYSFCKKCRRGVHRSNHTVDNSQKN